jgi:predicted small secreted protein
MMRKIKLIAVLTFTSFLFTACFGDKNTVIGQEFGDTSFINKEFTKNKVEFSALPKNMCSYINEGKIKELYPESSKILFDDGKTFMTKSCRFLIYMNDGEYDYLSGAIFALEDQLAEGEDWKETWELKKKVSKSSEFISGLGKTAIWVGKKRELFIKMDGYMITITVPGSQFKEEEVAKKRDYKSIALKIANSTGLF